MSDIAKKYQHYFNESVKLQSLVNEQAAYIAELEEVLASLDEGILDKIKGMLGGGKKEEEPVEEPVAKKAPVEDDDATKAYKEAKRRSDAAAKERDARTAGRPAQTAANIIDAMRSPKSLRDM